MNQQSMTDTHTFLEIKKHAFEQRLETLVLGDDRLTTAGRYSLLSGGKRLRPLLAMAVAEAFGASAERILDTACALEMIHTYSLIHDDLPCMDDDDFRRGKPTLHRAFDEATAVLAGDFLLTHAFGVITADATLSDREKVELITTLTHYAGGQGMIRGQELDLQIGGVPLDMEQLNEIHCRKTADLIVASLLCGGIIGGASPDEMAILRLFGYDFGLAFQINDDVLDVIDTREQYGALMSSDASNNRTTYVSLVGPDVARKIATDLCEQALCHLSQLSRDTRYLAAAVDFITLV